MERADDGGLSDCCPPDAATGRPLQNHRTVLYGILDVIRNGDVWSEMPEAFGPGSTLHRCSQRLCDDGDWDAILRVLLQPGATHRS